MEQEREVRLHQQIQELVRSRVGVLEQDISRLQREVNESFTRLLEQTDAAAELGEKDELLSRITADIVARVDTAGAQSARLSADVALLRDSVSELDSQRTQAEVLNSLVGRAANFAPRVVLFVVKGANALAWAARGFDDGIGNNSVRGLSVSLQSDTALKAALDSNQTFYGSPDQQNENEAIHGRLGVTVPTRVLAVPLRVRGKSAAVLYADSADRGDDATNVEAIELLVQTAGLVVELVSLRSRVADASRQQTAQPPQAPAPEAAVSSGPLGAASESPKEVASGELKAAIPGSPTFFRPATEAPAPVPPPPHMPAPHPAPVQSSRDAATDEEEKLHNDARRFARLLVSEIKLYNEQKVVDGRRNHDLYDRLREDIDRSRQMYEKRVSPSVASKFDYFHDELVHTLAEGDSAKLGSSYPVPPVSVQ